MKGRWRETLQKHSHCNTDRLDMRPWRVPVSGDFSGVLGERVFDYLLFSEVRVERCKWMTG
jgi:hypothetical protein